MAKKARKTKRTKRSKATSKATKEVGAAEAPAEERPAGPKDGAPAGRTPPKAPRAWEPFAIAGAVLAILGVNALLGRSDSPWAWRVASFLGIPFILGLALLMSRDRRRIELRTVAVGLGLQLAVAALALLTPVGAVFFGGMKRVFDVIFTASAKGAAFVFGPLSAELPEPPFDPDNKVVFAVTLVSIIVFIGALTRVLYHLGVMQLVVRGMAWLMRRVMRTSGAESLSAGANVFVGMVEAPLTIRPYVAGLTRSELFCVMTAGMATVAGSVLAFYAMLLKDVLGDAAAGHLVTASIMSAPAAILIAKIMMPETDTPATLDADVVPAVEEGDAKPVNLMDAAARGGLEGMKLGISVVGLLIAFVALVAFANVILGAVSGGDLSFQKLAGWIMSPVAVGIGVPLEDSVEAGRLMGTKTVLNELLAYKDLAKVGEGLAPHTARVMSYALCGFANFGSVAIMIAGIGGIAPKRRGDLARLGLLSIVSGTLAAFMTGCWAGLLG
ncbi:MAG: NupC/NupG family nucleoside CNT transporter [Planctomycetota bacterium]|jgi:CNT family concentrative nucleoside transporter